MEEIGDSELSRSMLSDRAYEALHARIIDLELAPGQRLNIHRLAAQLGVSPTPLREALRRLSEEDLVVAEAFKGFSVAPLLDEDELRQLADVRTLMEVHAIGQLRDAQSSPLEDVRREVALMDELVIAGELDVRAFNGADARFHTALVRSAANPTLERAYRKLNPHVQIARLYTGRGSVDSDTANQEHKRILAALDNGDPEKAQEELANHIQGAVERLNLQERA